MRPGRALVVLYQNGEITNQIIELWERRNGYNPITGERERRKYLILTTIGTILTAASLATGLALGQLLTIRWLSLVLVIPTIVCFFKFASAQTGDELYETMERVRAAWKARLSDVAKLSQSGELVAQAESKLIALFEEMLKKQLAFRNSSSITHSKKMSRYMTSSQIAEEHYRDLDSLGWVSHNRSYYLFEAEKEFAEKLVTVS